jgi:hypothetical protein
VGALTAPGVTASGSSVHVVGPGFEVDSVDGGGNNGHSFFSSDGATGIKFTFDANVLGVLPTHAALAWTDGDGGNRTFQAWDSLGNLIGTINDPTPHFFSQGDGDPTNYRLFGAIDSGGISAIFISNPTGGIEVDHLQYGFLSASVPEPSSLIQLLLGSGLVVGLCHLRRRPCH